MANRRRRRRRLLQVLLATLFFASVVYFPSQYSPSQYSPSQGQSNALDAPSASSLLSFEHKPLQKVTALLPQVNSPEKQLTVSTEALEGRNEPEQKVLPVSVSEATPALEAEEKSSIAEDLAPTDETPTLVRAQFSEQGAETLSPKQIANVSPEPVRLQALHTAHQGVRNHTNSYLPYGLPNFSFLRTGFESEFAEREFSDELKSSGVTSTKVDSLEPTSLYHYTIDEDLQEYAEKLLEEYRVPWGAIVALEPQSGRVLAMASHSQRQRPATADAESAAIQLALREGFPAASLFKVVTAAAAVERGGLQADSVIRFRGGDYTLNKYNYSPNQKRDKRKIDLQTALAKSCNPAFARVALQYLTPEILEEYAGSFGFNEKLPFDVSLPPSKFQKPDSEFAFARTAAGFANAEVTPLHAAMIAAAMSNRGAMMRPYVIERVRQVGSNQERGIPQVTQSYEARPIILKQAVLASTANRVNQMMVATVQEGTARRQFRRAKSQRLRHMDVAAKTGTLSGNNPKGRYHWLIASAPAAAPEIAIATLVIDPGGARINGTGLGRKVLDYYFSPKPQQLEAAAPRKTGTSVTKERG